MGEVTGLLVINQSSLICLGSWTVKMDTKIVSSKTKKRKEGGKFGRIEKRGFSLHNFPSFI